jgi:hypothetical protein
MTNNGDPTQSDQPLEEQGLPTSPVDDDPPGRSFSGDKPDAGADGSFGTRSDDADADEADDARAAYEEQRSADRGYDSRVDEHRSDDTTSSGGPNIAEPL